MKLKNIFGLRIEFLQCTLIYLLGRDESFVQQGHPLPFHG